jgi:hypothetical protein
MPFRNRLPKRHTLRTRPYRIRSILYIRAVDIFVIVGEDRSPDTELRVGAVRGGFGGDGAGVEGFELKGGYIMGSASFGNVS